ncbi:AraC-like DNA-binding protein [Sinobacterium caligoides]|uniref:AraC-like DNA-binding protein n=1 Tax=Sinobacterium caligoides TaxID=933926 RepID=A0A3N2DZ07_9GAMM|nr:AraC family transcriptional regulator [Sinobacterium caligoides]ROS04922.1 AraC-like DNA-binding protein [Sinobacterium caligoides]
MNSYITSRFSIDDDVLSIIYLAVFNTLLEKHQKPLIGYHLSLAKLQNPRARISPKLYYTILEKSLSNRTAKSLGFEYGKMLNMAAAGTVGQLLMSCKDISEVFQQFIRFYPLLSLSVKINMSSKNKRHTVSVERLYQKHLPIEVQQFLCETLFSCWLTQARWLTGKQINFSRVYIAYPAPEHAQLYRRFFNCEVIFDSEQHAIEVDNNFAETPVITANEPVMAIKQRHCLEVLRSWECKFSIREQIYTLLQRQQPDLPNMDEAASMLHLSRSSLYRKLRDSDTNYQRIVDDFRRIEAINYLRKSDISLSDIAYKLGFSDASNFRRAFKKWTGANPLNVRNDHQLNLSQLTSTHPSQAI